MKVAQDTTEWIHDITNQLTKKMEYTRSIYGLDPEFIEDLVKTMKQRNYWAHTDGDTLYVKRMQSLKEAVGVAYHQHLNPKIWETDDKLQSGIREALLKIAEAWRDYAGIPLENVKDIIFTGGNANYTYTKYSDCDVHLVVDLHAISVDTALLQDYYFDKKTLWTVNHPDIKVKGYNVELYAQPLDEKPHEGQGIFSLRNNKWVQQPKPVDLSYNNPAIKRKAEYYKTLINQLVNSGTRDTDKIWQLKDKLRQMRASAIEKGGEYGFENLVYKRLRNLGYIDKLSDYLRTVTDVGLSLEDVLFSKINKGVRGINE